MRSLARLSIPLLVALPTLVHANCYFVYTGQNQLVYQSTTSPIDLSKRIADGVNARFPGGYLVMIPDESACNEFRAGGLVQPRFDQVGLVPASANAADQALLASPLLRNSRSAVPSSSDGVVPPARTGTNLNLRGAPPGLTPPARR